MNKATAASGGLRFLVVVMAFTVLLWLSVLLTPRPSHGLSSLLNHRKEEDDGVELAGSLLPPGFVGDSCLSRYESLLYRRGPPRKPSPHLVSKLRSYEARHKKCGPHSHSYNRTLRLLESGGSAAADCNYLVWISYQGMGNKMLTLASAFLYALLTDRVLLVDGGADLPELFCEPFPEASWFLPSDFPFTHLFTGFDHHSNLSYGNLLAQQKLQNSTLQMQPPYIYLHLAHDYNHHDELFFCDQHQGYLQKVPWLVMRSDIYFTPSLFLMQSFMQELDLLFPVKETVFHFLGRYLFHPTNSVWGLITRFHHSYLSDADVRVGIQVRVYDDSSPFTSDQILSCTKREKILPQITKLPIINSNTTTRVTVVITSLSLGYFERIRDMYWENPTEAGEVVRVVQPSHEMQQQTEKLNHDEKALAEIYLLSLMDKLVTSGWSTFGYVAQGLAGLRPWIMFMPHNKTVHDPPCARAMSMEPCFHFAPYHGCKLGERVDLGGVVPHVRHCEDRVWDIKLV